MLEGSVASAAASGRSAPEFTRLPECETTAANEPDGFWQRRGKCSARKRIRQFYFTGTTTLEAEHHHRRTCTGPLLRPTGHLSGPETVAYSQSWRTITRQSIIEPTQRTQVTELSITSWNPDTLNHGKLERFLKYFDADITIFQGTRLWMRTIPKDGKGKDDTITPVKSEWCSRVYQIFSWGWKFW